MKDYIIRWSLVFTSLNYCKNEVYHKLHRGEAQEGLGGTVLLLADPRTDLPNSSVSGCSLGSVSKQEDKAMKVMTECIHDILRREVLPVRQPFGVCLLC